MKWIRPSVLLLPFVIASILTVRGLFSDALHLSRHTTEKYGFAFAAPWAWLLDHDWFGSHRGRWPEALILYLVLLWIPATLYSACLWMIMRLLTIGTRRRKLRAVP